MRLTVLGNPGGRRVTLFDRAVRAVGLPPPVVVAWRDVARGTVPTVTGGATTRVAAFRPGEPTRIDSPGEDAEVDMLLRGASRPAGHGEIVGASAWHRGLVRALGRVAGTGAYLLNDADQVAVLFDKPRCHALLAGAGIAVPPALPRVRGYARLREMMRDRRWGRVFVKPAHGSSASGVLALSSGGPRVAAVTSVEVCDGRLYNSLRVRRYDDERTIAFIVDRLAPDGLHVERWFAKASHEGRVVDLRVVVVAGRPTHVVVRASRHPMTNLHLGAARGDLEAVRAAAGPDNWAAAMDTCVRAAALFRGCLQVGVDLMFGQGWRAHAVAEVNAFGDLLPGLVVDGRDTYAEQVHALAEGRFDDWRRGGGLIPERPERPSAYPVAESRTC